jgi:hypothetical protein
VRKTMKALPVRLLLSLVLVAQLMLFAPTTKAASRFPTSQCTGTLTLTGKLGTITRAISFILIGTFTGPFGFSYSAVINGITYSAATSGTCAPR